MTAEQLASEIAKTDAVIAAYVAENAQAIEQNRRDYYRILDEQRRRALEQSDRDWEELLAECTI